MYYLFKHNDDDTFTYAAKSKNKISARGRVIVIYSDEDFKLPITSDGTTVENNDDVETLANEYKTMDEGVVADAAAVFNTTDTRSLLAFVASFQLRILAPEHYSALGLLAERDVEGFSVGDALDSDAKIKEYYTLVLVDLDMKRNTRIVNYLTKKAELGL